MNNTILQNQFLNEIKQIIEGAMNELIADYNNYGFGGTILTMDIPVGETKLDLESICDALENLLGINFKKTDFSWKRDVYGGYFYYYTFQIGTKTIELSVAKSLRYLVDEIVVAVYEELLTMEHERRLFAFLENNGMCTAYCNLSFDMEENGGIKGLMEMLGSHRYCDEEFIETIETMGYVVKETNFHGLCDGIKYIDLSEYVDGGKLWLKVMNQPYTMYQEANQRLRVEVLYILLGLKYGEAWLFEEF